jgi:hypothetical protein
MPNTLKPVKPKKCRSCKTLFQPRNSLVVACSPVCAQSLAQASREKAEKAAKSAERKADAVKREKLKSRSDLIREAQSAFNAFIRARDRQAGHACISSGRPLDWAGNAVDAGHYRSRGSAPHLRFDERNCHAQSKHDNRYASGNVVGYRAGLIERIGLEAVEELEADQTPRRYTIDDLKQIKAHYRALEREINATWQ